MNIAIVGFDYSFVKKLAEEIADTLKFTFIDFKQCFEKVLLEQKSVFEEDENLQQAESQMVKELCLAKNVVVAFPDDVVLSNKNYKKLKNNLILFINSQKLNNLQLNLKKLIKNINIEINEENFNFEDIINKIRGYYDR